LDELKIAYDEVEGKRARPPDLERLRMKFEQERPRASSA
jgi:hypothetical protein